jgi:hypothetical protein
MTRMTDSRSHPPPGLPPGPPSGLARCVVRGCIFPAAGGEDPLCLLHRRAEEEPDHFLSVQPSSFCLERARYGLPAAPGPGQGRPGRRLAAPFQQFCNKVA